MAEVVNFPGSVRGRPEEVIASLEALLEAAKAGRVLGLAYVAVAGDKFFKTHYITSGEITLLEVLGAVEVLKQDLGKEFPKA